MSRVDALLARDVPHGVPVRVGRDAGDERRRDAEVAQPDGKRVLAAGL